jgi:hypothetical protein
VTNPLLKRLISIYDGSATLPYRSIQRTCKRAAVEIEALQRQLDAHEKRAIILRAVLELMGTGRVAAAREMIERWQSGELVVKDGEVQ